jgi:hypothetical protein
MIRKSSISSTTEKNNQQREIAQTKSYICGRAQQNLKKVWQVGKLNAACTTPLNVEIVKLAVRKRH